MPDGGKKLWISHDQNWGIFRCLSFWVSPNLLLNFIATAFFLVYAIKIKWSESSESFSLFFLSVDLISNVTADGIGINTVGFQRKHQNSLVAKPTSSSENNYIHRCVTNRLCRSYAVGPRCCCYLVIIVCVMFAFAANQCSIILRTINDQNLFWLRGLPFWPTPSIAWWLIKLINFTYDKSDFHLFKIVLPFNSRFLA
jgi:hypothetical protein